MPWPLSSHFRTMLQTPRVAFRDPELKACHIERDALGQPRAWAGAFAVVYKATWPDGRPPKAVRVFSSESPERRERYGLISAYLKDHRPRCLVDFEYRDEAVRSAGDGKWYPMVLMDWVEGHTLFDWLRAKCLRGKGPSVAKAVRHWESLVGDLARKRVVHGDLQHANILVTKEARLRLVDYDGMGVPALLGRRNLELGVAPYQHPQRCPDTRLYLQLDNFSALVIYVALRALAAEPRLWKRHVERTENDKLLFRREDFLDPASSALYVHLKRSPDQQVRRLTDALFACAALSIDKVPPLSDSISPPPAGSGPRPC